MSRWRAVLVGTALTMAGCGDDGAAERPGTGGQAAGAAAALCEHLRSWENDVIDAVNETAQAVTDTSDPVLRRDALVAGVERLMDLAEQLGNRTEALPVPETAASARVNAGIVQGADRAVTALVELRDELAAVDQVTDEQERGRVGQLFNAVEKVFSLTEPRVEDLADDRPLRQAIEEERACRFVVLR